MKRIAISLAAAVTMLVGCSDAGQLTAAHTSADVRLDLVVPGRCLVGGCDPVSAEANQLGLLTVTNEGTADAFLQACGDEPEFEEQILSGQMWVFVGPAVACPTPSNAIRIAAGQSLQFNWWFGAGVRRLEIPVGHDATLANASESSSQGVSIF